MRCNVGRYPDGSIYCCPEYARALLTDGLGNDHTIPLANAFFFCGIIPPPDLIKNDRLRARVRHHYDFDNETRTGITWQKEDGWTHEMIRAVMKSAREMES